MKTLLAIVFYAFAANVVNAVELAQVPHRVIADERTFVRDARDRRYCVWTASPDKATALLSEFNLKADAIKLKKGEILAVFLNDRIEEDLVQIIHNKTAHQYFADYANSGIEFKLHRILEDKKFSHMTAIIFTSPSMPSHLGMRGMIPNGLSEKH